MSWLASLDWFLIITSLAKTFGLLAIVLTMVSYTVYAERRVSALIQDRLGPNRTGFPTTLLGMKRTSRRSSAVLASRSPTRSSCC